MLTVYMLHVCAYKQCLSSYVERAQFDSNYLQLNCMCFAHMQNSNRDQATFLLLNCMHAIR